SAGGWSPLASRFSYKVFPSPVTRIAACPTLPSGSWNPTLLRNSLNLPSRLYVSTQRECTEIPCGYVPSASVIGLPFNDLSRRYFGLGHDDADETVERDFPVGVVVTEMQRVAFDADHDAAHRNDFVFLGGEGDVFQARFLFDGLRFFDLVGRAAPELAKVGDG